MIANHYAPQLSALDRMIAQAVPPGGNWKNVPESVPSQRLAQIRRSYAAGEGSRSTYYGRLRPDAPAYTINTYFGRPGNGCHIHYDFDGGQHRTLSQREAARLQSFPDNFVFCGSHTSINQQIGNAVPPLLAYQIARSLPYRGHFVDLFCGAGGLSLGFIWAGWRPIIANDIEAPFLDTYRANVDKNTVLGDIRDREVFEAVVRACHLARHERPDAPLFVLGGPPCQGFSTAGERRTMHDERNWLFRQYRAVLEEVRPTGFVFENVMGLLNMEEGRVFKMILGELKAAVSKVVTWQLRAEEYAIPQRRTRLIIIGSSRRDLDLTSPSPVTQARGLQRRLFGDLPEAITVYEALSDLPPLEPGEDGSDKDYVAEPMHPYQQLMRSYIRPAEYFEAVHRMAVTGVSRVARSAPQGSDGRNGRPSIAR